MTFLSCNWSYVNLDVVNLHSNKLDCISESADIIVI